LTKGSAGSANPLKYNERIGPESKTNNSLSPSFPHYYSARLLRTRLPRGLVWLATAKMYLPRQSSDFEKVATTTIQRLRKSSDCYNPAISKKYRTPSSLSLSHKMFKNHIKLLRRSVFLVIFFCLWEGLIFLLS
jgi:hypothetical protein